MKYLYLFLIITSSLHAQNTIVKGFVVDSFPNIENTNVSFASYVPRTYQNDTLYPTVFVFDDRARAASAVQQFTIASALTESIILGANFKLSERYENATEQIAQLIAEAATHFSIDKGKLIAVGVGKNAKLLSEIAQNTEFFYGLIAIDDFSIKKSSNNKTLRISLLAGDETSGYFKINEISQRGDLAGPVVGARVFDGNGWPTAGYLSAALTDILLHEHMDQNRVASYFESDIAFAGLLYDKKKYTQAFNFTTQLKRKYDDLIDLTPQKKLKRQIRRDIGFRKANNLGIKTRAIENTYIEEYDYFLEDDLKNVSFDNLGWWNSQMDLLDAIIPMSGNKNSPNKSAIRLKNYVRDLVENAYDKVIKEESSLEKELFINVLRTLVDPLNHEAFIEVIALSAQETDYNAAYFYLEELLKTGYSNKEMLYEIPYTNAIIIGPEWNEIIKTYLGSSKYY